MYLRHPVGVSQAPSRFPRTPRIQAISPQQAFGARVRALRLAAQMTQEDLSEHCGLFRTYMSRIETGQANPTLTMIHALAVALGVPAAALLATDAEPDPAPSAKGRNRKLGNPPSRGRVG